MLVGQRTERTKIIWRFSEWVSHTISIKIQFNSIFFFFLFWRQWLRLNPRESVRPCNTRGRFLAMSSEAHRQRWHLRCGRCTLRVCGCSEITQRYLTYTSQHRLIQLEGYWKAVFYWPLKVVAFQRSALGIVLITARNWVRFYPHHEVTNPYS